jgi:uncharacterized protein YbaP (TraB family)
MKRLMSGWLAAAVLLAGAGQAAAEPPMWIIRDPDSTIVLFGSVHVLPPELDWRSARLDEALAQADDIWFETPLDADAEAAASRAVQANAYLPQDQALSALLSPVGQTRLKRVSADLGIPLARIDRLRPWYADIILGVTALARQGALVSSGVEQTLAAVAPTATRRSFETPGEQIAFFAGAPLPDQITSLEDTLRQLEEDPGFYDRLIAAWIAGDAGAIETLGLTPMKQTSLYLYDALIVQRNLRWAKVIADRLAGSGETVIIVGVGHLVGPDSVPALLRARGITVEGP